jgi:hypothetical protein
MNMLNVAFRSTAAALVVLCASALPSNAVTTINPDAATVTIDVPGAGLAAAAFVLNQNFVANWFFDINNLSSLSADIVQSNASNNLLPMTVSIIRDSDHNNLFDFTDSVLASGTVNSASATVNLLSVLLTSPDRYYVRVTGGPALGGGLVSGNISLDPVPLPGALPLFASGLFGLWALRRKRKAERARDRA